MGFGAYHIETTWRVDGSVEEISAIFRDPAALPRWWPAAFLRADVVRTGNATEVGKTVDLITTGWLPYTLRFRFTITEVVYPRQFSLRCWGDFCGGATCRFTRAGGHTVIHFVWRVRVTKPLIKYLTIPFKPIFIANHRWVMSRGRESLQLEIERRRAGAAAPDRAHRLPPGPTFTPFAP